jgi:hypothetical protein
MKVDIDSSQLDTLGTCGRLAMHPTSDRNNSVQFRACALGNSFSSSKRKENKMSYYDNQCSVTEMLGATLVNIEGLEENRDSVVFTADDGRKWQMYHCQDCCEHVNVEDVCGVVSDLIGSPLLMAEEETSVENPEDYEVAEYGQDRFLWTYYKFATIKGYVTVRWYGESNGYYAVGVSFRRD